MILVLADIFTVIAVAAFAGLLALTLTIPSSPLCIRRRPEARASVAPKPVPVPQPRTPRDTSRSYPRPKASRSKLNQTCPVCGTGRETGGLDGKVHGWPAHRTCAEWLGDWKPGPDLDRIRRAGQKGAAIAAAVSASPGAQVNVGDSTHLHHLEALQEMALNGAASVNEVRERLNREIVANWGVPPAILQEHTRKAGDPLPVERCPGCGAQFVGTPGYLREAYKLHRRLGCRQQCFACGSLSRDCPHGEPADPGPVEIA